jgi:hypothetical protein
MWTVEAIVLRVINQNYRIKFDKVARFGSSEVSIQVTEKQETLSVSTASQLYANISDGRAAFIFRVEVAESECYLCCDVCKIVAEFSCVI